MTKYLKYTVVMVFMSSILILQLIINKISNMYEAIEHHKVYKQEKELQAKIAKEFKLNKAIKEANNKEFDEWMESLIAKNGTTNY